MGRAFILPWGEPMSRSLLMLSFDNEDLKMNKPPPLVHPVNDLLPQMFWALSSF